MMVESQSPVIDQDKVQDSLEWWNALGDGWEAHAESVKNEFAIQLSRTLRRQEISRAQFAKLLETSPAYVSKLLRGDSNCSIETMAHAAYVLGERLCLAVAPSGEDGKWLYGTTSSGATDSTSRMSRINNTSTVFTVTAAPVSTVKEMDYAHGSRRVA